VLIGAALRRGLPWRELLKPNAALAALIAVALFASLSALWAADPKLAVAKGALLLAAALTVFATAAAIATLDEAQAARPSSSPSSSLTVRSPARR